MRQPTRAVNHADSSGTIAPPTPMPRYAMPMTLPRVLSNQRETSTWHGSGPPHT